MFNSLVLIILSLNLMFVQIISLIYLEILYFIVFSVSIIDGPSFVSLLIISHIEILVGRHLSFTYMEAIKKHGDLESSFRCSGIFLFKRIRTMHLCFLYSLLYFGDHQICKLIFLSRKTRNSTSSTSLEILKS